MIFDKDVIMVSLLSEFKQAIINYEKGLKSYFESTTQLPVPVHKNSAPVEPRSSVPQKIGTMPVNNSSLTKDSIQMNSLKTMKMTPEKTPSNNINTMVKSSDGLAQVSRTETVNVAIPLGAMPAGNQPNYGSRPIPLGGPQFEATPEKYESTSNYFVKEERKQVSSPKSSEKPISMQRPSSGSKRPLQAAGFEITSSNIPKHLQSVNSENSDAIPLGGMEAPKPSLSEMRMSSMPRVAPINQSSDPVSSTPGAMPSAGTNASVPSSVPQSRAPPSLKDMAQNVNLLMKTLSTKPKGGEFINSETSFGINGSNENDRLFLARACKLKFPSFSKLLIGYMDKYTDKQDIVNINYFMTHSIANPIQYLILSGGGAYASIGRFKAGIAKIPKQVMAELYLVSFDIDDASMKTILEASAHIPKVLIRNSKVDISQKFTLNAKLDYQITELDLYETYRKDEDVFLNTKKLTKLAMAMSKTSLKTSLNAIHIYDAEFDMLSKAVHPVQELFDDFGYSLRVYADTKA